VIVHLQGLVFRIFGFRAFGPLVTGHFQNRVRAGLEDEQSGLAVGLYLQSGLNGLDAKMYVLLSWQGRYAQLGELVPLLGVVVGPYSTVFLATADLLDSLGVVGQRLSGLIVFGVNIPSAVRVPCKPQADKGVIEAPVNHPIA